MKPEGKTPLTPRWVNFGIWIPLCGAALSEAAFAIESTSMRSSLLPALVLGELRLALASFFLGAAAFFALRGSLRKGKTAIAACIAFLPVLAVSALFLLAPKQAHLPTVLQATEAYAALVFIVAGAARLLGRSGPPSGAGRIAGALAPLGLPGIALLAIAAVGARLPAGYPYLALGAVGIGLTLARLVSCLLRGTRAGPLALEEKALEAYRVSEREREIARLVARGSTNQEIADALFISLSTVKAHLASLLAKTGTKNRVQMIAKLSNPTASLNGS
jgi:DNA-binding CsgD family transcriptional regulator